MMRDLVLSNGNLPCQTFRVGARLPGSFLSDLGGLVDHDLGHLRGLLLRLGGAHIER